MADEYGRWGSYRGRLMSYGEGGWRTIRRFMEMIMKVALRRHEIMEDEEIC